MRSKKQNSLSTISASEIGQYHYCSVAWYLQKCGFEPESELLEIGAKKHIKHGNLMEEAKINTNKSKLFSVLGYALLALSVLIILLEVFL